MARIYLHNRRIRPMFPVRFEPMAQDHTRLKQQWFAGQTVLPCYAFTSCIEWQSDPFTAVGVDPCLHLSASGTEFQTRYNPAADLFMGTKTVLAGGGAPQAEETLCMRSLEYYKCWSGIQGVFQGWPEFKQRDFLAIVFLFNALCPVHLTWASRLSFSLGSWSKNSMLLIGRKVPNR